MLPVLIILGLQRRILWLLASIPSGPGGRTGPIASALGLRRAGHLYRRAAFGASWEQLQQALHDGPGQTIDRLLRPEGNVAEFNRTFDGYEAAAIDPDSESVDALGTWWLRRMMQTPHPLLEKMTLFWHNHFAVSNAQVKNGWLMYRHVQMLRRHALGQFPAFLAALVRDPAMLTGLGAGANRKAAPTETFSRVLMDQYVLGRDQASAADVRESGRAMTGWFVMGNQLRYLPHEHDDGVKDILGEKGAWSDEAWCGFCSSNLLHRDCWLASCTAG